MPCDLSYFAIKIGKIAAIFQSKTLAIKNKNLKFQNFYLFHSQRAKVEHNYSNLAIFTLTSSGLGCYNYNIRDIHIVTKHSMKGIGDE